MIKAQWKEAAPGQIVDRRYEIRRGIAQGGIGIVAEAEHLVSGARVALKALRLDALSDVAMHARVLREARALAMLRHPNIVTIFDAGNCPIFGPYLVLELLDGRTLDGFLATRARLDVDAAVGAVVQVAEALSHAHAFGIVHRDIKPSNVLISRRPALRGDHVTLVDFGIASFGPVPVREVDAKLTRPGELLGTVEYMSPEQMLGDKPVDARTDVWALGVMLYECLAGETPWVGTATRVVSSVLARTPAASLRQRFPNIPEAFDRVIARALSYEPDDRYASPGEFAADCLEALGRAPQPLALIPTSDVEASSAATPPALPARRQFVRAPYITPTRIIGPADGQVDGRTEDISEGGVLVITSKGSFKDGDRVQLRLPLPASGRVATIECVAKWATNKRGAKGVGLQFIDLPSAIREEIARYVSVMAIPNTAGKRQPELPVAPSGQANPAPGIKTNAVVSIPERSSGGR